MKITGTRENAPITKRIPLKENGARNCEPRTCATNANPHIIAVIKSRHDARRLFFFVILFFLSDKDEVTEKYGNLIICF
jgi:hypothetical protein